MAETPPSLPVTLLWVCSIASHKCGRVAASLWGRSCCHGTQSERHCDRKWGDLRSLLFKFLSHCDKSPRPHISGTCSSYSLTHSLRGSDQDPGPAPSLFPLRSQPPCSPHLPPVLFPLTLKPTSCLPRMCPTDPRSPRGRRPRMLGKGWTGGAEVSSWHAYTL